jgi:hypothetical protein
MTSGCTGVFRIFLLAPNLFDKNKMLFIVLSIILGSQKDPRLHGFCFDFFWNRVPNALVLAILI